MELWEILVPASKASQKFTYDHHKEWDEFVMQITGGMTIFKPGKGLWDSPSDERHTDRMIPVRIMCKEREDIIVIISFTKQHYNQEAVMAYRISDEVIIR